MMKEVQLKFKIINNIVELVSNAIAKKVFQGLTLAFNGIK